MWQYQWGGKEFEELFRLYQEDHGKPHPALAKKPVLRAECIKYLDAFQFLSTCRLWSQLGPQALQVSEIGAYLDELGIEEGFTRMKYLRLIKKMDLVELNHIRSKQAASRPE